MADASLAPAEIMRRNLSDVFSETSRERRDAVIDELYDGAVVFQDSENRVEGIERFKDHVDHLVSGFAGLTFSQAGEPGAIGELGRVDWVLAPAGGAAVASGTDIGLFERGRLVRLWTFVDGPGA